MAPAIGAGFVELLRRVRTAHLVATVLLLAPVALHSHAAAQAPSPSPKPGVVEGNLWILRLDLTSTARHLRFRYGRNGDAPLMGDWDGNDSATPGVTRRTPDGVHLLWLLRNTNSAGPADVSFVYGLAMNGDNPSLFDIPIVGDWDGNGTETAGIVRVGPQQLTFLLRNSNTSGPAEISFRYGRVGFPVVGDWDGNGTDTPGVVRIVRTSQYDPGQLFWYLRNSNSAGAADTSFVYGSGHDFPLSADWDGDGTETPGVVRRMPTPPGARWLLRNSNTSGIADVRFDWLGDDVQVVWR